MPHLSTGDILVANHPVFGGSHLPDVSVLARFGKGKGLSLSYNRAHHARSGESVPVPCPRVQLPLSGKGGTISAIFVQRENPGWIRLKVLQQAEYPSRQISENLADLSAQVASLRYGIDTMEQLIAEYGDNEITQQMNALREEIKSELPAFSRRVWRYCPFRYAVFGRW